MNGREQLGPDWVISGSPTADGRVMVMASNDLSSAMLEYEAEAAYDEWSARLNVTNRVYTLTVKMGTYRVCVADDYETALRHLMETWTPAPRDRRAIDPRLAIGPSPSSGL